MDTLAPLLSQIIEALHNKNLKVADKIIQNWGQRDIPQQVFENALDSHNTEFVCKYIDRSSILTKHNILDRVVSDLDVVLTQRIIFHISKGSYPFLAATMRVYKKENSLPMLQILTHQLTTSEKIILAKGLMEGPPPLQGGSVSQLQERINCLTQDVGEAKLYSILTQSSLPRTKEAFRAAIDHHQSQRIRAQISSNNLQRSRKL